MYASTTLAAHPAASAAGTVDLTEAEFDARAEDTLEQLSEDLEALEPTAGDEFEIDYAMGVLTLVLNESQTYVLNKQRPNRQIWLSSPTSGPRRFNPGVGDTWIDVRTGENLLSILHAELSAQAPDANLDALL